MGSLDRDPGGQKWPTKIEKVNDIFMIKINILFSVSFFSIFGSQNPVSRSGFI
jgi:hypothetical protein